MRKIVELVLNECIRILEKNRTSNADSNMGEFPQSAIVVFNTEGTEDGRQWGNGMEHKDIGIGKSNIIIYAAEG